jgi:hypothetical protein
VEQIKELPEVASVAMMRTELQTAQPNWPPIDSS